MLYITSIRVFEDCDIRYRKNLSTTEPYIFKNDIPDNFFGKNISIHAIVGKNGSGKSTLLEIIMRLTNNLGFCMCKGLKIPIDEKNYLCYIYNLHAELTYSLNGKKGSILCKDEHMLFEYDEKKYEWTTDRKYSNYLIRVVTENPKDDFSQIIDIASKFFYTISINYSLQSYNATDYIGEETFGYHNHYRNTFNLRDVWINRLFHKNDGYMCPIVLNPYRKDGIINMGKEMNLTKSRIETLLLYYKFVEHKDFIEGYSLYDIVYKYNPVKVTDYFNDEHFQKLVEYYRNIFDEKELGNYKVNKKIPQVKAEMLSKMLKTALFSKEPSCFPKAIFEVFDIETKINDDEVMRMAQLYLICKLIHIINTYPSFDEVKLKLFLVYTNYEKNRRFDINDIFVITDQKFYEGLKTIISEIKDKINGHIGLKVRRVLLFLKRGIPIPPIFDIYDYIHNMWQGKTIGNELSSLSDFSSNMPPSIYDIKITINKDLGNGEIGEPELFDKLSSGERQFIFTTSTLVYHLQNLKSTVPPQPHYYAINIIFDEIEICFHPEYQREFLLKLVRLLTRLKLNDNCSIHIFIATHSPFILSDIPQSSILYLREGKPVHEKEIKVNPFAANINEILAQSFFLKDGFIGKFAEEKIKNAIKLLRSKKELSDKQIEDIKFLIENIGEPLLKESLKALLYQRDIK